MVSSQELAAPDARSISEPANSEPMRGDARLSDVSFVDRVHGWAVGDRGTIWHTDDGGRNWGLQRANVRCPLCSVFFLNPDTGWAAGGGSLPYSGNSSGVVLFTHDGGQHWVHDPKLLLPALKQVRFSSERHGWAVGCPSAMFPSGVFVTEDGGRNWNPLPSARTPGWSSGDFLAPYQGVVAGHGAVAVARRAGLEPARTLDFGLRNLTRLKLVPPSYGWLVGQGGLVMLTGDAGASWRLPPSPLPDGVIAEFDFTALEVRGPKVWIAGAPGSRILHSPDAGHTWLLQPTGQSLPIRAISFADDACGWAVGDLGTILATSDGGQTWNRQRAGGARAALLGVFGDPQDVPLEVFARLSGNEGYLGQVEIIGRRDLETPSRTETAWDDRFHEAMIGVGASGAGAAWQFPLRQPGLELSAAQIVAGWDAAGDHHALEQLEAYLVRQIRLWRPDVLVTKDPSSGGVDPLAELVGTAVAAAAIKAEDPSALSRQITLAGLAPWKVKRIYAATRPGVSGTINLATSQLAPRLGRSLADVAATPRGLVSNRCQDWPASIGFRLVQDESPDRAHGKTSLPASRSRRAATPAGSWTTRRWKAWSRSSGWPSIAAACRRCSSAPGTIHGKAWPWRPSWARWSAGWTPTTPRKPFTTSAIAVTKPVAGRWRRRPSSCSRSGSRSIPCLVRRPSGWCSIMPAARRPGGNRAASR